MDGNEKLVLAFLWQVMRYHTLQQLSKLAFDGFTAEEGEILRWANGKVSAAAVAAGQDGAAASVSSFSDPRLASGIFLLYLLSAIRDGCVDWSLVADGSDKAQQLANARYVLSVARRLGAQVFCTATDITECKMRPLMLLVAGLMVADTRERRGLAQATDGEPEDGAGGDGASGPGWVGGAIGEAENEDDGDDDDSDDGIAD